MAATHAADKAITVPCETATCTAYLTVEPDAYVPDPWVCPACADAQHEQQISELERTLTEQEPAHESQ